MTAAAAVGGAAQMSNNLKYLLGYEIGTGAYGKVLVGYGPSGQVAIKRVRVSGSSGIPYSTLRELAALRRIARAGHPNVVPLLDVLLQPEGEHYYMYLVFELLQMDLERFLATYRLAAGNAQNLGRQLLLGLQYLHSKRIMHRDLKPQNCLVSADGSVLKIADFNMARVCGWEKTFTSVVTTLWYRSPEVLLTCGYSSSTDVWSAGCILYELVAGQPLFTAKTEMDMLVQIFSLFGLPDANSWPAESPILRTNFASVACQLECELPAEHQLTLKLLNARLAALLAGSMLRIGASDRCTAAAALKHSYFSDCYSHCGVGRLGDLLEADAFDHPDGGDEALVQSVVSAGLDDSIGCQQQYQHQHHQQEEQLEEDQEEEQQTLFPVPVQQRKNRQRQQQQQQQKQQGLQSRRPLAPLAAAFAAAGGAGASPSGAFGRGLGGNTPRAGRSSLPASYFSSGLFVPSPTTTRKRALEETTSESESASGSERWDSSRLEEFNSSADYEPEADEAEEAEEDENSFYCVLSSPNGAELEADDSAASVHGRRPPESWRRQSTSAELLANDVGQTTATTPLGRRFSH